MTRRAVLFDLDGTLCDTRSVEYLVTGEEPDYHAFHSAAMDCPVNPAVVEAMQGARKAGSAVIVLSSREFIWRDLTLNWLDRHGIEYDGLYLRYSSDFRPAATVKAELLGHVREDGFDPVEAWEDADDILALWRDEGMLVHDARVEAPLAS